MDYKLYSVNKMVKRYDPKLWALREGGAIHIYRKQPRVRDSISYDGMTIGIVTDENQHICSLTHNWSFDGQPREWGLEPLWTNLQSMDSWREDGYEAFCKRRDRAEEIKKQSLKNDIRAKAADLRSDFAKATNDIVVRK